MKEGHCQFSKYQLQSGITEWLSTLTSPSSKHFY